MANLRIYSKYKIKDHRHRVNNNAAELKEIVVHEATIWIYKNTSEFTTEEKYDTSDTNQNTSLESSNTESRIDGWIFKQSSNSKGESRKLNHSVWPERKAKHKTLESGLTFLYQ